MRILTFSIVAGSLACNARCPFCVAHMTPVNSIGAKEPKVNWRNFRKAARLARDGSCSTAMITSKGEPTIFPDQVTQFLKELAPYDFPITELQTNGLLIADGKVTDETLQVWYDLGLTTIAISVVHYNDGKNREIYTPHREYPPLVKLIAKLKGFGFTVRLATVLVKGYLDSVAEVENMINFARIYEVDQLTFRPVTKPDHSESDSVYRWTVDHAVEQQLTVDVNAWLEVHGEPFLELTHGATVWDVDGQNVCMTNCLTVQPRSEEMRQLIFFPDGATRYTWQHKGSRVF